MDVKNTGEETATVELTYEEIRHINTYLQGRDEVPPGGARVGQVLQSEFLEIEESMK